MATWSPPPPPPAGTPKTEAARPNESPSAPAPTETPAPDPSPPDQPMASRTASTTAPSEGYYYLDQERQEIGPLPLEGIRVLRNSNTIQDGTYVRSESASAWSTVSELLTPHTTVSPEKPAGEVAFERAQFAVQDAKTAWSYLLKNPAGGLPTAWEGLGPGRSAAAGYAMLGATALVVLIAILLANPLRFIRPHDLAGWLKLIFGLGVSCGVLPVLLVIASKTFSTARVPQPHGSLLVAGSATLPWAAVVLLFCALGLGNTQTLLLLTLIVMCVNVLQLFIGLIRICGLTEIAATAIVPLIFIVSFWAIKVVITALH